MLSTRLRFQRMPVRYSIASLLLGPVFCSVLRCCTATHMGFNAVGADKLRLISVHGVLLFVVLLFQP
jgi:hypothetical protein